MAKLFCEMVLMLSSVLDEAESELADTSGELADTSGELAGDLVVPVEFCESSMEFLRIDL